MLQNHYKVNKEETIEKFLKNFNEKKISHYIILEDETHYVSIRNLALKFRPRNKNQKLTNFMLKIPESKAKEDFEKLKDLYKSGQRLIKTKEGFFDLMDGLKIIKEENYDFLNTKLKELDKNEIYALEEEESIAAARNLFLEKKINLLPIIDSNLTILGEVRPFDFLQSAFIGRPDKQDIYDKNQEVNVFNLPAINIANRRPHTIDKEATLKEAMEIMLEKKLPSIIVTEGESAYSVVSYGDIFTFLSEILEEPNYNIEYQGTSELFPDDYYMIQKFAERSMNKITRYSDYKDLRLKFKLIGNKENTSQRKFSVKANLSHGKNTITVEKETRESYKEDEIGGHGKDTPWNTPLLVQEALSALESKAQQKAGK